jgi:hypothetical protein
MKLYLEVKGKAHPLQAMQAQRGLGELRLYMVVGCQPHAPAAFTPRDIPGTRFHEGLSQPLCHGLVGRKYVYVTEKSSDTTGNRSRDRPTSSAAP